MKKAVMEILFQNTYANFVQKHPIFTVINIILGSLTPILFLFLMITIKNFETLLKISNIFIPVSYTHLTLPTTSQV